MVENQKELSRLEQRSVINSLVAEMGKLCEIYRIMYDVYGEACFSQKHVYTLAKHSLPLWDWVEKIDHSSGGIMVNKLD